MGSGTFDTARYASFTSTAKHMPTDRVYASLSMDDSLNPKDVKIRESRDSVDNPNSTPVIVALDVTGSMGMIADVIAKEGLGTLFTEILTNKPISDPHLMFMAIGDANFDSAPLQTSQFEADNRIVDQLTKIWLEHGGGGNMFESYNLAWYFAAYHTEHDSFINRGKKGYLFTVGDEEAPKELTVDQIKQFIGDTPQGFISNEELITMVERTYHVFHIVILEGNHVRHAGKEKVLNTWKLLLGQRVIALTDYKKLAETIVGIIEATEGIDTVIVDRFGSAVKEALIGLPNTTKRLSLEG